MFPILLVEKEVIFIFVTLFCINIGGNIIIKIRLSNFEFAAFSPFFFFISLNL